MNDRLVWNTGWRIRKFKDPDGKVAETSVSGNDMNALSPYADDKIDGNLTLDIGYQTLIDLIAGTGTGRPWDNANAHIGIGDGTAPVEPGQTGLQGTNKTFRPMDATWPHRMGRTCVWRATFGPGDAEYVWAEFVIANGSDETAICLNRKVKVREAKPPGETWVMDLEMIFGKVEG